MKRTTLLLVIALFISHMASAQFMTQEAEEEENVFVGKWQEYERTFKKQSGAYINFTDTMQLQFMEDSMVRVWFNDGRYFNEPYYFERKTMLVGEKYVFKRFLVDEKELSLRNGNEWHHFKRVNKLKQGAIKKRRPGAERGNVDARANVLVGKWSSYKKEDPAFTGRTFYLRQLEIKELTDGGAYKAEVIYANMADEKRGEGTVTINEKQLTIRTEDKTETYEIMKLEGSEMTLTKEGAILYFKEFSR